MLLETTNLLVELDCLAYIFEEARLHFASVVEPFNCQSASKRNKRHGNPTESGTLPTYETALLYSTSITNVPQ